MFRALPMTCDFCGTRSTVHCAQCGYLLCDDCDIFIHILSSDYNVYNHVRSVALCVGCLPADQLDK